MVAHRSSGYLKVFFSGYHKRFVAAFRCRKVQPCGPLIGKRHAK
jgi:hypothetical protein